MGTSGRDDGKVKTIIDEGGLRYTSKKAGSVFGQAGGLSFGGSSMSCFKCGEHRAMSTMSTVKILGRSRRVCGEGCKKKADQGAP